MKADAWICWQAVESEQAQISLNKNWGLLHGDFNGGQKYYITKKYYGVEQYTRFIRPGYKMIDINNSDAVAFMELSKGKLVIVQRNTSTGNIDYSYDLSGFKAVGITTEVYRTSDSEDFAHKADISISNKTLSATANAKSITTYVISGVTYGDVSTKISIPAPPPERLFVKSYFDKSHDDIIWTYQPEEIGMFQVYLFHLNGQMAKQLYRGPMKAGCIYQGSISSLVLSAGVFILAAEGNGKRILRRCTIGR